MNFYADYLAAQSNDNLPGAITSALDGRLGMFEDRMSSLLYKHAVELDMMMGILADSYELTEEDMRAGGRRACATSKTQMGGYPSSRRFA